MRQFWASSIERNSGCDARAIESFEDPAAARRDLRALFEEFLAALVTYFDVARWGRARHATPCDCCGAKEQEELMGITHEQQLHQQPAAGFNPGCL